MLKFSDKVYEFVKKLVTIILPAAGTAYLSLAALLEWDNGPEVAGAIVILTTFLGACLTISTSKYRAGDSVYDGNVVISTKPEGGMLFSMEPETGPSALQDKKIVTFRVLDQTAA